MKGRGLTTEWIEIELHNANSTCQCMAVYEIQQNASSVPCKRKLDDGYSNNDDNNFIQSFLGKTMAG